MIYCCDFHVLMRFHDNTSLDLLSEVSLFSQIRSNLFIKFMEHNKPKHAWSLIAVGITLTQNLLSCIHLMTYLYFSEVFLVLFDH